MRRSLSNGFLVKKDASVDGFLMLSFPTNSRVACEMRHLDDYRTWRPDVSCDSLLGVSARGTYNRLFRQANPDNNLWSLPLIHGRRRIMTGSATMIERVRWMWKRFEFTYSTLRIIRGHFSSNNSRKTLIARPWGRGMGVFLELLYRDISRANSIHINLKSFSTLTTEVLSPCDIRRETQICHKV